MDESDAVSEGSDIDIDLSDIDDNVNAFFEQDNVQHRVLRDGERQNERLFEDDWIEGFFDEGDDDGEFDGFDPDWIFDNFSRRQTRPFTGDGGPSEVHPPDALPHHYFAMIWGDDLWDHLVTETNRYAEQERERNPPPPFATKWKPVDRPTMKAFIGLILCMGVIRLPARYDYWRQKKKMFANNFGTIMSRDRFSIIWRYLHLQDNEVQPDQPDKLWKIWWFLDYLCAKFRLVYTPNGIATVDESMVKFKGRLSFRQYLPSKPIKWGMKIWALAESATGYLWNFQVYTGKADNDGKGLAHRVVTDLLPGLQFRNLQVYMDNFYTSVGLMTDLVTRGVQACGTNRKDLPRQLLPKNNRLEKHQYRVAQRDDLTFCSWMDTKPVLVLSNFHDPTETGTVNRRSGNAHQQQVQVPKMLADYQTHMKGVDLCDQMIGYYMLDHRSKKWWRRLFFYFLMAAAHNSYIVANESNEEEVRKEWPNFQDFVEDIATGLIDDFTNNRHAPRPDNTQPNVRHEFVKLFDKEKVCVECRAREGRGVRVGTSKFGCRQCRVPVHTQCFPGHINRANN